MADKHLYWYIESLALTANQRNTLVDAIRRLGKRNSSDQPHERTQLRVRPDGEAAIFEMWIDENNLTTLFFRQRLANIFGVALAQVTATTTNNTYGSLATFTYSSQARLRMGVFGGINATYEQSAESCRNFLSAFPVWDTP